ncbi:MAG: hypothetical protein ABI970_04030, partial [Chloroflexota bacterium]
MILYQATEKKRMLVRAYRLTDKLGIVILKSSAAFGQLSEVGVSRLAGTSWRIIGGVLGFIAALILGILRGVIRVFSVTLKLFGGGARRVSQQATGAVGASTSTMMARRAARAEMTAKVTEDPLRVQNRTLSALFVLVLAALIGVVLWATNPARQSPNLNTLADLGNGSSLAVTNAPLDSTGIP